MANSARRNSVQSLGILVSFVMNLGNYGHRPHAPVSWAIDESV